MSRKRIVSLLPSCTEIVATLGCADQLAGRSHECDFPPELQSLPVCTKAKIDVTASSSEIDAQVKANLEKAISIYEIDGVRLKELRPDIILTQSQCDVCAVSFADVQASLPQLLGFEPQVISLAPNRFADLWKDIETVAAALDVPDRGRDLVRRLKERVVVVIEKTCTLPRRPSVACIEWLDPLMAVGNWTPDLVDLAGAAEALGAAGEHSTGIAWEALVARDPEFIIAMPCGFDLERTRREMALLTGKPEWAGLRAVRSKKVFLADGNQYFNRPGPRLVDSLEILAEIIHPKLFSFGHEGKGWSKLSFSP